MRITPAIIVGAGSVAAEAAAALLAELKRLYGEEPWLKLIHGLTIGDSGEIAHLPPEGFEQLLQDKALAGIEKGMSLAALMSAMAGKNRAYLGDEILAELRHQLHRTDLAKEMSRHGHELDQGLNVFIISPAFDGAGGAATAAVLLALSRLHRTGITAELSRARVISLLPDLFPDLDGEQQWARVHEYFRELETFVLDARLLGEPDREIEVDLGVTVLSRALGSGLAISSWRGYLLPLAELVSHEIRNLLSLKDTERGQLEGKPACLGAFGFFRFFYPRDQVDAYLLELTRHRWFRRFVAGSTDDAALDGELALFGERTGMSKSLESEIEKQALVAGKDRSLMPSFSVDSISGALRGQAEQTVSQLFKRLRQKYEEAEKGQIATQTGMLLKGQVELGKQVIASFDELAKKLFALPVQIEKDERLSLAAAPAMIRMLIDPQARNGLGVWEKGCLAAREELLGAAREREELESVESALRDAIRAAETAKSELAANEESREKAREKRLNELDELKAKLEPGKKPEDKPKPGAKPAATAPKPAASSGGSLADQLWGKKSTPAPDAPSSGGSISENLWGAKTEPQKDRSGAGKSTAKEMDPAAASRLELLSRTSPEELELETREKTIRAQLDKIERERPLLENKAQAARTKLEESRKFFLEESLHQRRLAEIEREKIREMEKLEEEAISLLRESAEHAANVRAAAKPVEAPRSPLKVPFLILAALLAVLGLANIFFGFLDPIGTAIGLSQAAAEIFMSFSPIVAGAILAVIGLWKPAAKPTPIPAAVPGRNDAPQIASLLNKAAKSLDELLDLHYRVNLNYQALQIFSRLRAHAQSTLVGLDEFKTFFDVEVPPPARMQVEESPWEISLAPGDLADHLENEFGAALQSAIREDTSPEKVWEIFREFEKSAEKPDLEARVLSTRDRVFRREREEVTMGERLLERLKDSTFREFFGNLLSGLGVSAMVNEETACPSSVRKTSFLALHAPDTVRDKVMEEVAAMSGLDLAKVEAFSPGEMSIFLYWSGFAPFQLAQLMKARDVLSRLLPRGEDNRFSLLPEPDCRRLPDPYPLIEVLPPATLKLRELGISMVSLGLIEVDWATRSFAVDVGGGKKIDLRSFAEVLKFLASPDGEGTRLIGEKVLEVILSGGERGQDLEARVDKALKWIDETCRDYERRETVFHALEDDDFRVLLKLPEKFIRV